MPDTFPMMIIASPSQKHFESSKNEFSSCRLGATPRAGEPHPGHKAKAKRQLRNPLQGTQPTSKRVSNHSALTRLALHGLNRTLKYLNYVPQTVRQETGIKQNQNKIAAPKAAWKLAADDLRKSASPSRRR